jgi:uncharacterized protein with ParB-like and HNH nuclease domain
MSKSKIQIYSLPTLFHKIENEEFRIPLFQRKFVWKKKEIIDLLRSVYKGFPIGTFYFIETSVKNSNSLQFVSAVHAQVISNRNDYTFEIIDGTQRLKTLYYCLYSDSITKDSIFKVGFNLKTKEFFHQTSRKMNEYEIELTSVFSSDKYIENQIRFSKESHSSKMLKEINDLYTAFRDYQVPVVTLTEVDRNDVVEIFQRLNAAGIHLSKEEIIKSSKSK